MGAASAGFLAPRAWASRRPRSRATLFPASAARLLLLQLLVVASQPSGKALLCSLTRGTWRLFAALEIFSFPSLTRLREAVQSGSDFEVLSLVIFIYFAGNQPSEHSPLWRRAGLREVMHLDEYLTIYVYRIRMEPEV